MFVLTSKLPNGMHLFVARLSSYLCTYLYKYFAYRYAHLCTTSCSSPTKVHTYIWKFKENDKFLGCEIRMND